MAYKTVPVTRKSQKLFQLVLHLIALVAGIVTQSSSFTLSWEFLICIPCILGWACLPSAFLVSSGCSPSFRSGILVHNHQQGQGLRSWLAVFGMVIFFMAILSAETGLVEKFISLGLRRNREALIVYFTGLLILLFAVSVGLSVLLPK